MAAEAEVRLVFCQKEKDILNRKLNVHIDRWALEKEIMEDNAAKTARQHRLKEAEHAFEVARADLLFGSQQQQLLLLKRKLDSALEDLELKEDQISVLNFKLQEEKSWNISAKQKLNDMKASLLEKVASENQSLVSKSRRKAHRLQKLLDETKRTHKIEVEKLKEQSISSLSQLQQIQLMLSQADNFKGQQKLQSDGTGAVVAKVQALLQEMGTLNTDLEKYKVDEQELQVQALGQERDQLRMEQANLKLQLDDYVGTRLERDKLLAEKDHCILHSSEFQMVLDERDRLNIEKKKWLSLEKEMEQMLKERDMLTHQLEIVTAQREHDVNSLLREKNFVWSQMKRMEDDNEERIRLLASKALQNKQELERVKLEMKDTLVRNNEMMVEMSILKLDAKRAEDAIRTQRGLEAELQDMRSSLEKIKEEKERLVCQATSQTRAFEMKLDSSCGAQEKGLMACTSKGFREVSECGLPLDPEIYESQVENPVEVPKDSKKFFKSHEQLLRENENLLLETQNLKTLYSELEVLYKMKQKPVKVTRAASNRDPISRNLKLELEAVASSPLEEIPVSGKRVKKRKRLRNVNTKHKDASIKQSPGEKTPLRVFSPRRTRSSKRMLPAGKDPLSEKIFVHQTLNPSDARCHAEIPILDSPLEQEGAQLVQKLTEGNISDPKSTKHQRPPLHLVPLNQRNSPVASRSSMKSVSHEMENQSSPWRPEAITKKMMAGLFSSAFSVPRLKGSQLRVVSRT